MRQTLWQKRAVSQGVTDFCGARTVHSVIRDFHGSEWSRFNSAFLESYIQDTVEGGNQFAVEALVAEPRTH